MGLTHKLMDDFKFNTTILQHVIDTVHGITEDDEFDDQGMIYFPLFMCGHNVNFMSFVLSLSLLFLFV